MTDDTIYAGNPPATGCVELSHNAVNPFIVAQVHAIVEDIRLLEAYVTAPLGLYSDLRMLRESLPIPQAADLSREETLERRAAYGALTDTPLDMALETIASARRSLDILEMSKGEGGSPLEPSWVAQGRRVLDRAEQRVAGDIRAKIASRVKGVYVIVDPEATRGRPVVEVAEAALRGGAKIVQLRDKVHDKGDVLPVARQLSQLCEQHDALFIINDDADLALSTGAHGLHVGQSDLPVADARHVLTSRQIVGRSNNTVEEAVESEARGADYIAVGAIFPTGTMGKSARPAVGVQMVREVKELVSRPVVAIGGITAENVADVASAGAECVCVVSAITLDDDPEAATRRVVEAMASA